MVEGHHTVVELGEAGGHASDSKLGLGLGKPNPRIICSELWKFDSHGFDVEGGSGRGFGYCVTGTRHKPTSLIELAYN